MVTPLNKVRIKTSKKGGVNKSKRNENTYSSSRLNTYQDEGEVPDDQSSFFDKKEHYTTTEGPKEKQDMSRAEAKRIYYSRE